MTHPDIQRAIDAAARELARRIRANPAPADPDGFAARFIEDMHGQGWRPIPRPQLPGRHPGAGAPPNTEWRQAAARIRGQESR